VPRAAQHSCWLGVGCGANHVGAVRPMTVEDHAPDVAPCRACGHLSRRLRFVTLIGLRVRLYECPTCEYVQTEQPYWLERAYATAINDSDTGMLARNMANARIVLATLWMLGQLDGRVVDYAGGYGILVRLLRDYGVDALWTDAYCENLLARGFEHNGEPAALVTAFEAFEHFVEPERELDRMLRMAPNVLLSTVILPKPAPADWWYYGRGHGQHIGLFRVRTLQELASRHGRHLSTNGVSHHLLSSRPMNERRWRFLLRANRMASLVLSRRLDSRTWSDHELIAATHAKSETAG
jgi:hypothetical protein